MRFGYFFQRINFPYLRLNHTGSHPFEYTVGAYKYEIRQPRASENGKVGIGTD